MNFRVYLKNQIDNLRFYFKKTILIELQIVRAMQLLGILLLSLSSCMLSIMQPFLNNPEYWFVSVMFSLVAIHILFMCIASENLGFKAGLS